MESLSEDTGIELGCKGWVGFKLVEKIQTAVTLGGEEVSDVTSSTRL